MKSLLGFLSLVFVAYAVPPREVPRELYQEFTLNGRIPVQGYYFDGSYSPETPVVYTFEEVEMLKAKALAKERNYYGPTDDWLYSAFEKYPIAGKTVAIMGSTIPWYEAIVLTYGGFPVTIEYNKVISEHPDVRTMTVAEYEANPEVFDAVVSISSYEHDGLGRYGDPINPTGDFQAMAKTKKMLKPGGFLFLAVPVGRDVLAWNAHRIYGPIRLPLLLAEWKVRDSFGYSEKNFRGNDWDQPVFVLEPER